MRCVVILSIFVVLVAFVCANEESVKPEITRRLRRQIGQAFASGAQTATSIFGAGAQAITGGISGAFGGGSGGSSGGSSGQGLGGQGQGGQGHGGQGLGGQGHGGQGLGGQGFGRK